MKKIATLTFLLFSIYCSAIFAQCTPVTASTAPGIYPDTIPEGIVGLAYSEDITFVMPTDTMGFDFINFEIVSISLPAGLSWACNSPGTNCNYNPQVSIYGCVNVFGTPLLAGDYNVQVTALADLTVANDVNVTFDVFFKVNPASVSATNGGFSFVSANTCAPTTVNFTNNNPGLLSYSWNFGNGNISNLENPADQIYATPGEYIVNYEAYTSTTTTYLYTLTNFSANSMSNYGGFLDNADAYFKILNSGSVVYSSPVITDTDPPVSWSLSLNLDPALAYTIELWESDAGEFGFGADDYLGSIALDLNGCTNCAVDDGTISYTINETIILPSPSITSSDTITVYGTPSTPDISYDLGTEIFTTTSMEPSLQWYFNGNAISGATLPTHVATSSGNYHVVAFSAGGCPAFSDTLFSLICLESYIPSVTMSTANSFSVTNPNNLSISWYRNGILLAGQSSTILDITVAGNYHAVLFDSLGCSYNSDTLVSSLSLDESLEKFVTVFPNPSYGIVNFKSSITEEVAISVYDVTGKEVTSINLNSLSEGKIDLSGLEKNVYFIVAKSSFGAFTHRLILY